MEIDKLIDIVNYIDTEIFKIYLNALYGKIGGSDE